MFYGTYPRPAYDLKYKERLLRSKVRERLTTVVEMLDALHRAEVEYTISDDEELLALAAKAAELANWTASTTAGLASRSKPVTRNDKADQET